MSLKLVDEEMKGDSGIFLINKPTGMTSHDVIDFLRKVTGERTIGHAGTLDPAASGLLIVAVSREFTKKLNQYLKLDKEYIASIELGKVSTTYDSEGEIADTALVVGRQQVQTPSQREIVSTIDKFLGNYKQLPPAFSAKKIRGKKAYELARKGKDVDLKPVPVTIHTIEVLTYNYPNLQLRTRVSSGTYIRSLAHDIGQKLGTGAYLSALQRTKIGEYDLSRALALTDIKSAEDLEKSRIE